MLTCSDCRATIFWHRSSRAARLHVRLCKTSIDGLLQFPFRRIGSREQLREVHGSSMVVRVPLVSFKFPSWANDFFSLHGLFFQSTVLQFGDRHPLCFFRHFGGSHRGAFSHRLWMSNDKSQWIPKISYSGVVFFHILRCYRNIFCFWPYPLIMTNSLPWKIIMLLIGKPW